MTSLPNYKAWYNEVVKKLDRTVTELTAERVRLVGEWQDKHAALAEQLRARDEEIAFALAAREEMEARKDAAYLERNKVVRALAAIFPSGIARTAIEGWSEDWHGCVYIDLPSGQVSWHYHDSHAGLFADLPPYTKPWDGHDTDEKYRRVLALTARDSVAAVREAAIEECAQVAEGWSRHSVAAAIRNLSKSREMK